MKKHTRKMISSLAVLTLAAACGGSGGGGSKSDGAGEASVTQREEVMVDGSNVQGFYLARFNTLNGHIVGTIPGSASFTRKDDKLFVYLRMFAGAPKAWHMQGVYTGSRCPTLADDTNGDGTIDINEAMAVVGKLLIPLDSDPSTQAGGRNFYPLGDLSGSYHYERVINFNRFLSDLQAEDKDPNDHIVKLGPDTGLSFIGKVVMIQGVTEDTQLPETVGTMGRHRAFQTLPIACGVYDKVEATPGVPIEDEIPGPVAEVEEGQDRPAPEDDWSSTGGSGSGSTTGSGTNDSDDGHGPVSDGEGGTIPGGSGSTTGSSGSSGSTSGSSTTDGSTTGGTTGGRSGWWSGWSGRSGGSSGDSSTSSTSSSGESSSTGGETSSTTGDGSGSSTTTTTTVSSSSSSSTGE